MLEFDYGKLREWRRDRGLSQQEVAKKIFRSPVTVSKWENGETSIPTEDFIRLVDLYGVDINEALYRPLLNQKEPVLGPEVKGKDDK